MLAPSSSFAHSTCRSAHLDAHELEAPLLEAADDLGDLTAVHAVRLDLRYMLCMKLEHYPSSCWGTRHDEVCTKMLPNFPNSSPTMMKDCSRVGSANAQDAVPA